MSVQSEGITIELTWQEFSSIVILITWNRYLLSGKFLAWNHLQLPSRQKPDQKEQNNISLSFFC